MHCRTCGYDLWNLAEPRCPECGNGFDLRTYRFTPGTVAFACPGCGNLHAGAGERYLPATAGTAVCQGCGEPMEVTRMRVVPLVPNPPDAVGSVLPWEDRASLGWWRAWWRTTKLGMLDPGQVPRQARPGGTWATSYFYAATTYTIGIAVNVLLLVGFFAVLGVIAVVGGGSSFSAIEVLFLAAIAVLAPLMMFLFAAAPAHLFLWLFAPERKGGIGMTARFVNYAQAPVILMAIPVCGYQIGGSIGWVWAMVSAILMLRTAQGVSGLKASLAVLWLPAIFIVLYLAAVAVMVFGPTVQP